MKAKSVVVVGGGISGLTVAWLLQRSGLNVTVLEREQYAGGTIRTFLEDDWLIESGPNTALETTPLFARMFRDLGILPDLRYADPRAGRRYILRQGKLHAMPTSVTTFLTSSLWTAAGKLRLLKEPFIGRSGRAETLAEFVERRLGKEFLHYAIDPFVGGVYAGSPETLDVRLAFPKIYALEERYGSLVRGMIMGRKERKRRAETAKNRARMFSFVRGMQTFPDAIAKELGSRVRYNCNVLSLHQEVSAKGGGFSISCRHNEKEIELSADGVILAAPAHVVRGFVRQYSEKLAALLEGIHYPPVAEVFLGFREDQIHRPLDGFGYLIPSKEKRKILGTLWSSAIFSGRAPQGHCALTTFVGGTRNPELVCLSDDEITGLVVSELKSIMSVSGVPVFAKVIRWEKAIPQYGMGHGNVIEAIAEYEADNRGVYFCGNYRGGISVGDCVANAETLATRVIADMNSTQVLTDTTQELNT